MYSSLTIYQGPLRINAMPGSLVVYGTARDPEDIHEMSYQMLDFSGVRIYIHEDSDGQLGAIRVYNDEPEDEVRAVFTMTEESDDPPDV